MELPSNVILSELILASLSASSTRFCVMLSTLMVALPLEICTAGASPKKLGKVNSAEIANTKAMTMYFHKA